MAAIGHSRYKGWAKRAKRWPRSPRFKPLFLSLEELKREVIYPHPQRLRGYRLERLKLRLAKPMPREVI